ncbi:hypothetical protein GPL21_35725 [Bradyrhizobium pachyrhizi]|uniref:Uncharacterized protein n=1 Tax=Bradyrhizobium pachyrhizi TaxID=280333 RepID=A0A844SVR3_9BRAD|nr:hypothetical protein [Bradyrhizobium pachyrhizi]MVT70427.1 hypothetical protein [Bradyrhizobium pachyrhizi]
MSAFADPEKAARLLRSPKVDAKIHIVQLTRTLMGGSIVGLRTAAEVTSELRCAGQIPRSNGNHWLDGL